MDKNIKKQIIEIKGKDLGNQIIESIEESKKEKCSKGSFVLIAWKDYSDSSEGYQVYTKTIDRVLPDLLRKLLDNFNLSVEIIYLFEEGKEKLFDTKLLNELSAKVFYRNREN